MVIRSVITGITGLTDPYGIYVSSPSVFRNNEQLLKLIESSLQHKSEMVIYEAARAIVSLRGATAKEVAPAVSVLQLLCSSPKPALRYAAVRTLNSVAVNHPTAVIACNVDLEHLIADPNRSVATLAVTTLLKVTGKLVICKCYEIPFCLWYLILDTFHFPSLLHYHQ